MEADIILTKNELEKLFYNFSIQVLGQSPLADVRISWPTGGAPAFGIDDNVTFLKVTESPLPNEYHVQHEEIYSQQGSPEAGVMSTNSTRGIQVGWIFYGTTAWNSAALIKDSIFRADLREMLSLQKIYPIANFTPPRRIPENWQGLWYDRYDLTILFYEQIKLNREVDFIEKVKINTYRENGDIRQEEITESTVVR